MSKVRDFRKEEGMTLAIMAARVGISPASMFRIETGDQWPSPEIITRIVDLSDGKLTVADVIAPKFDQIMQAAE